MASEVPDGKRVVKNGAIIAVCCYSVGEAAVTEEDKEMEGKRKPAAVRLLAVMPEFWGLCVGQRMLQRAEKDMIKEVRMDVLLYLVRRRHSNFLFRYSILAFRLVSERHPEYLRRAFD